jgi:DNA adenine methylase
MGGYARSEGKDCYAATTKRSLMKQLPMIRDVRFTAGDYRQHSPKDMLVYCDPPYESTTSYGAFDGFDHDAFWETMRTWSKENTVVISEYKAPDDFLCVKEFASRMGLTAGNERPIRVERLFMHQSYFPTWMWGSNHD